jgi:preprotein translocase subunit YajC
MYFVNESLVFAMTPPGGVQAFSTFLPFAIILGIFYFLILLPMKRRQKKIQEFQENLKAGDKIVTTGGMYGKITRVTDKTLQVEIADRVRIELSRAAVAGYQASGAGMAQTYPVSEVNGSGFNGNIVLTDLGGGKTKVAFTLTAPDSVSNKEADHDSHIHTGTCAAPGPVVHPLEDVRGNGTPSESEVPMALSALQDGNHLIAAHADEGEATIACAEIKKSGM